MGWPTLLNSDQPALWAGNQAIGYRELNTQVVRLADGLGTLPPGPVGLLLHNQVEWVVTLLAAWQAGRTVVPLNTHLTAPEVHTILADAGATVLVTGEGFEGIFSALTGPSQRVWVGANPPPDARPWEDLLTVTANRADWPPAPEPNPAVLVYTSGTTGRPKGVMLSLKNLRADAEANAQVIEATASDRFVTVSPLFHVFGLVNILLTSLSVGASVVLVRRFSPKAVLEAVQTHRVTFLAAVPTMYQLMLAYLAERPVDVSSVRVCHSGAAPLPEPLFHAIEATFGAPVQEGYGLSEASSIVTSNPLHGVRKPGTVGLPLPGVRLAIGTTGGDATTQPFVQGEVWVSGPTVCAGYWQRPDRVPFTVDTDGTRWLKTGDMGFLDEDGYLTLLNRQDDLINVGGVKVYPAEIEAVLHQHPAVAAAVVVGQASELYHETVSAFVVTRSPVTARQLTDFCAERLAAYKIPSQWQFVSQLPQGPTGKILRRTLRETVQIGL
jgi:long-chain acyl-CoA synthetase